MNSGHSSFSPLIVASSTARSLSSTGLIFKVLIVGVFSWYVNPPVFRAVYNGYGINNFNIQCIDLCLCVCDSGTGYYRIHDIVYTHSGKQMTLLETLLYRILLTYTVVCLLCQTEDNICH